MEPRPRAELRPVVGGQVVDTAEVDQSVLFGRPEWPTDHEEWCPDHWPPVD